METKIRNDLENIQKLLTAQRCEILAQKTEIAELTAKLNFHHQEEHSLFEEISATEEFNNEIVAVIASRDEAKFKTDNQNIISDTESLIHTLQDELFALERAHCEQTANCEASKTFKALLDESKTLEQTLEKRTLKLNQLAQQANYFSAQNDTAQQRSETLRAELSANLSAVTEARRDLAATTARLAEMLREETARNEMLHETTNTDAVAECKVLLGKIEREREMFEKELSGVEAKIAEERNNKKSSLLKKKGHL